MDEILQRLNEIERLVKSQRIALKKVFTFGEACAYCGYTASHMYKLTSANAIPHYKPNGKMIFFLRSELDAWLLRNRNVTLEEVREIEASYLNQKSIYQNEKRKEG